MVNHKNSPEYCYSFVIALIAIITADCTIAFIAIQNCFAIEPINFESIYFEISYFKHPKQGAVTAFAISFQLPKDSSNFDY